MQITGWVRNNPDGSVEVLAMGTREQLSGMRSRLREGPRAARVEDVEESEAEPVAGVCGVSDHRAVAEPGQARVDVSPATAAGWVPTTG